MTLLNVLGVLGVLNVLNVLDMPMDASLACWALSVTMYLPHCNVKLKIELWLELTETERDKEDVKMRRRMKGSK